MSKFKEYGTLKRRAGSGGSNNISGRLVTKIKRLSLNKNRRGARKVAAMVGVSDRTVRRTLMKAGARPYHKRKVHAMTAEHKTKRVAFASWALQQYGLRVNGNKMW